MFKEGEFAGRQTEVASEHPTEIDGEQYSIVDTVGIGYGDNDKVTVLTKLARTCHTLANGVNKIPFVSAGKFTKEGAEAYDTLRHAIFDEEICRYVTIVRTKARFFQNPEKVKKRHRESNIYQSTRARYF